MKPDPSTAQSWWEWTVGNSNAVPELAYILLTHHQPVSAQVQEAHDAQRLHTDDETLLVQFQEFVSELNQRMRPEWQPYLSPAVQHLSPPMISTQF
jgi:hypothetical protein